MGGVNEFYFGEVKGFCIDLVMDVVVCIVLVKEYVVVMCFYGLVDDYLLWVWDIVVFG